MGLAPFPKDSSLWVIVREGGQIDRMTYAPLGKREGKVHVYKLRIVSVTPARLHGGITAATRLPSGSRESRMGFASEMSSPTQQGDVCIVGENP
jgi:hypothetical protein